MGYSIKTLYIDNFKGFDNFYLEFEQKLTVLIGENGTGKTTILEIIYNMFIGNKDFFDVDKFTYIKLDYLVDDIENTIIYKKESGNINVYINDNIIDENNDIFRNKKIIYIPTEVTFYDYHSNGPTKMDKKDGDIKLTAENMSKDFKQFLVNQRVLDLNDISNNKEPHRIEEYKNIFNDFLTDKEFLEINLETFEPVFRLKETGEIITVDKLSSGEKQIFFKGGSLLQYGENESLIVLIDEPEISMHPEWQQKILKYYTNINPQCQFIFSTHSAQIVSCCRKNEIRVIEKVNGKLNIKKDIIETYGSNEEKLLFNIFDLKSVRNNEVQDKIEKYKELYCKLELTNEEKEKLKKVREELKNMNISDIDLQGIDSQANTEKLKRLYKEIGGTNA